MKQRIAVLYRVSTKKQLKKRSAKDSIDQDLPLQRIECERFIASKEKDGWEHSGLEYIEGGVSGFHTHTSKRKVLMQAYEDAKAGKYDVLLVYKLDRFGRRSSESLQMALNFIRHCRIWVVDKAAEFKQATSVDELMNFIEFWSAKNASLETKRRVTDAMLQLFEEGCWTGGQAPYGYNSLKHRLEINEREAQIVRQVFTKYVYQGMGYHRIAVWLNEEGIKPRHTDTWDYHQIMKMIRLPIYNGYLSYGKHVTVDTEFGSIIKRVGERNWKVNPNRMDDLALVDEETWERAQKLRQSRVRQKDISARTMPSRTGTGVLLLGGLTYCSCGSLMGSKHSVSSWKTKEGKKRRQYLFYYCSNRLKGAKSSCHAKRVSMEATKFESAIFSQLKRFMKAMLDDDILSNAEKMMEKTKNETENALQDIVEQIKEYQNMKKNAERMLEQYFMGKETPFPAERINQMLEMAEKKLKELELTKNEFEKQKPGVLTQEHVLTLENILKDWDAIFDQADPAIKRAIAKSMVERVVIQDDMIEVDLSVNISALLGTFIATDVGEEVSVSIANGTTSAEGNLPLIQHQYTIETSKVTSRHKK